MTFVILHFKIREFTWQSTLSKHSAYIRETFARGNSLCWTVTVLWPEYRLSRSGHTLTANSDGVPLRVLEGSGGLWALQLWQCRFEENCSRADMEHAQGARKGLREREMKWTSGQRLRTLQLLQCSSEEEEEEDCLCPVRAVIFERSVTPTGML